MATKKKAAKKKAVSRKTAARYVPGRTSKVQRMLKKAVKKNTSRQRAATKQKYITVKAFKKAQKEAGLDLSGPLRKGHFFKRSGSKYPGTWLVVDLDRDGISGRNIDNGRLVKFSGKDIKRVPPPKKVQVSVVCATKRRSMDGKGVTREVYVIVAADKKSVRFGCEKVHAKDVKAIAKML